MKRPSLQWYPADWRNNAKLRRCSWAARGAWADLLGLLHDSDEYGVLRWPIREIIQAVGCPAPLVRELVDKLVLKGIDRGAFAGYVFTPTHSRTPGDPVTLIPPCDGPVWFSSRLVRDEYKRAHAGASTRFTGSTTPPNNAPTRRHGARQGDPPGARHGAPPSARTGDGTTSSASSLNLEVGGLSTVATPVDNSAGTGQGTPENRKPRGDKSPEKVNTVSPLDALPERWHGSNEGIEYAARLLGVFPKAGQGHNDLKLACFERIAEMHRGVTH